MDIIKRFVRYVTIDTQSNPESSTTPSTMKQLDLAKVLVEDLKALDIECTLAESGIVYARLHANCEKEVPTIGFIAHMDTAFDLTGANVRPKLVKNYNGQKIILNKELGIYLDPKQFPVLLNDIGDDLIVTDGTTLLGGDDKAGVAEIMDMLQYLKQHPELEHGDIAIAFTPDEEVGRGTENFDIAYFNADYAYTVDGGDVSEIEYENFNASSAEVVINGLSIHPGSAKGQMLNSIHVAMEFDQLLPKFEQPACTEGYEGFHHLNDIVGNVDKTTLSYILRDHDRDLLDKKERDFFLIQDFLNAKYGQGTVTVSITQSYGNMKAFIEKRMEIVDRVKTKMQELGLTPRSAAIRGGTDGAFLTYNGLLCPNLGTGGRNFHGRYEYVSIDQMRLASKLLVKIACID